MNIFARLLNFFRGALSLSVSDLEKSKPEVAFENAINTLVKRYDQARNAVASLIAQRTSAEQRLAKAQKELDQVEADLAAAVATENMELGTILLQKKDQLDGIIKTASEDLERISASADAAKEGLLTMQSEIDKLRRERDEQLARYRTAQAENAIADQLSGLSTDAEIRALDNVREGINQTVAKASLNKELNESDLDSKLRAMRKTAGQETAKQRFAALVQAQQESSNKNL